MECIRPEYQPLTLRENQELRYLEIGVVQMDEAGIVTFVENKLK
jgi:hypothetical protein